MPKTDDVTKPTLAKQATTPAADRRPFFASAEEIKKIYKEAAREKEKSIGDYETEIELLGFAKSLQRAWRLGTAVPKNDVVITKLAVDGLTHGSCNGLDRGWLSMFLKLVIPGERNRQMRLGKIILTTAFPEIPDDVELISLGHGRWAKFATPTNTEDLPDILNRFKISCNRPAVALVGGAAQSDNRSKNALQTVFNKVLLPTCQAYGAAIIDGATDVGVPQVLGQAKVLTKIDSVPLIGVLTEVNLEYPGNKMPGANQYRPEPNHTHFIAVNGDDFQDASDWLALTTSTIAGTAPSVTVVADGGGVTWIDLWWSLCENRPIIALDGSGRAADIIADGLRHMVKKALPTRLAATGLLHSVHIRDTAAFAELLEKALRGEL